VQASDAQPYFAIATNYGFANYMFQSNEGPSFPAHQFLFTGTSAPTAPPNLYFAAENGGDSYSIGCPDKNHKPLLIDPAGIEQVQGTTPACYPHDSLVTNANGDKGVSWRYYTPTQIAIWDAPLAIPEVCYGENDLKKQGQDCGGTEWGHIVMPNTAGYDGAPILDDIANCSLQKISWVIPDQIWSDHPGPNTRLVPPLGPSWVGDIIDAIGNSWTQSKGGLHCDYWGNNSNDTTAIFVVWDDWGGWFDHVLPPQVYRGPGDPVPACPTTEQPNGWGCGYVYGFRVPLLVVSEYTKAGYVSGACTAPNCPNNVFPYVHDFGSILAFTEHNFGLGFVDQSGDKGYADFNALDWSADHATYVPLSDFFSLGNQRNFTNIPTVFPPDFYKNYYVNNPTYSPTGPDGTDSD
jgi:phospholipase C